MFVRIKKIKGNFYVYLVENTWTPKGSRQKTKAYLGKLQQLEKIKEISFEDFLSKNYKQSLEIYIEKTTPQSIVLDLLICELQKHGFTETLTKRVLTKESLVADLNKLRFFKNNFDTDVEIVLKLNNEFMCKHTIQQLFALKINGDEDICGQKLAETIVAAGISLQPELFIALFEKIYKNEVLSIQ